MIKKAVFSYWEDNRRKTNGGFRTKKELAMCLSLAVELVKRQFETVELVTNSYGKKILIDQYKIPFNSVQVVLDQFDNTLEANFWAYIKLYAYSIQDEPFIHIDNDVFIWDIIPYDKLTAQMLFQNKEMLEDHRSYYDLIREAWKFEQVDRTILRAEPSFAYNCGVVGVNDLSIVKRWIEIARQYIFSPANDEQWQKVGSKHNHNHVFEQYFISAIIKRDGIEAQTLLKDDFHESAVRDFKYTHLWGEKKREQKIMDRVRDRLFTDYPHLVEKFLVPETHPDVFEDIYRNEVWGRGQGSGGGSSPFITTGYRDFLQKLLVDLNIKSVIDFGCGDWQFSQLINWSGISYYGYDCVRTIIENDQKKFGRQNIRFDYADEVDQIDQRADLLIIKDVLIHWPNETIKKFLQDCRNRDRFKYVLITNSKSGKIVENNFDISVGGFHSLDINAEPFNARAEEVYRWDSDSKMTYLIRNERVVY